MDQIVGGLKALADESRLKILSLLLARDLCVGALAKNLSISEAAVSQHLRVLRKAGIVRGEKRGYFTHYHVDTSVLRDLADKINGLASVTLQCGGGCAKTQSG